MSEPVVIEIVSGVEGYSCYINSHRVAGPKPWGGGTVVRSFRASISDVREALGLALVNDDNSRELASLRAFKRSVDEALNSGDGSYRP